MLFKSVTKCILPCSFINTENLQKSKKLSYKTMVPTLSQTIVTVSVKSDLKIMSANPL